MLQLLGKKVVIFKGKMHRENLFCNHKIYLKCEFLIFNLFTINRVLLKIFVLVNKIF